MASFSRVNVCLTDALLSGKGPSKIFLPGGKVLAIVFIIVIAAVGLFV